VSEVGSTKTGNSAVDAFRENATTTAAPAPRVRTVTPKKGAIRRGESGSPLELLGSRALKSWRAGGYAARTDFPRSLAIAWRSI
jgi:hypothetical protein